MMMIAKLFLTLLLATLLCVRADAAQLTACTAGTTTCSNDTTNDQALDQVILDLGTQNRVWNLWNQQCANIFSEATTTTGHSYRVSFCQAIAAQRVPMQLLVSAVLNSTVVSEILANSSTPAGNMVDADVNTAIGAALTVTSTSASTTATQATTGVNFFTVASVSNIVPGQTVSCTGVSNPSTVLYVSGTTVYISGTVTAALVATSVAFLPVYYGLATRPWG